MTPNQLLDQLFADLHATTLPEGAFRGTAWSHDLSLVGLVSRLWSGKVFVGGVVANRILGRLRVPGTVHLINGTVEIRYPQFGLTDRLKPFTDTVWLGRLSMRGYVIWFTLAADQGGQSS